VRGIFMKSLKELVLSSRNGIILLTAGALLGSGILAKNVYAGAVVTPPCETSRISQEFEKLQRDASIRVSIFPTLVSVPSGDGIIYALGNTREIGASGMGTILLENNVGMTVSGKISGFYSSNKIFSSDEELGSAESAGGFVNASIGGVVKSDNSIVFGNLGGGIHVLNVLDSEYAGEKGGKQTENGLNWNGTLGVKYVTLDSTLTLSVDGKGGFDVNDGSLDLRGIQNCGFNIRYNTENNVSLSLRIAGENEAGDQTPFSNTFYEGSITTSLKNLFGENSPDYLNDISLVVGSRGAVHTDGPVTKYAEGDKTSCILIGLNYNFKGGKISATSEVSLDNPVKTDTGMPPAGINFNYTYKGDQL
jgi:hypothetical protein